MLPFDLCSAPNVFNAIVDALECLYQRGIRNMFHHLDDFIIVMPPRLSECDSALATLNDVCVSLRALIAEHKRDGPTTCVTFLRIEIDTVTSEPELPAQKLLWL